MQQSGEREYILFCDESDREGTYFSNFYGGLLIGASQYQQVSARLDALKSGQNLFREVKWNKVTSNYVAKYEALIHGFFDEIDAGRLKIRIMFRQNAQDPLGLSREQRELTYWLLYYQFVKHAFGLQFMPSDHSDKHLRLYFDQFPDTGEQAAQFKGYIEALQFSAPFRQSRLLIRKHDIAEVDSHDHVLLQCLDIVLGAMCFRLNDKHLAKPPGSRRRGKTTLAKASLYKTIHARLGRIRPHFNIGITTGGGPQSRWTHPYAHWKFTPSRFAYDESRTKGGRKKNPAGPT